MFRPRDHSGMTEGGAPELVVPNAHARLSLGEAAAWMRPAPWSDLALAHAVPGLAAAERRAMPLGLRDAWIVAMREAIFGNHWEAQPLCQHCGESYEMTFAPRAMGLGADLIVATPQDGLHPVTLGDLLTIEAAPSLEDALLARVGGAGQTDVSAKLEALDPAANLWLRADCPDCGNHERHAFDPVLWLMRECTRYARSLLNDIVDLAQAFHWSEDQILQLNPARRAYYLAEVRA